MAGTTRRAFIKVLGASGSTLALLNAARLPGATISVPKRFEEFVKEPPASVRPQVRWWWPGGTIDPAEIRREVAVIADAGFGGFEIADVRDSIVSKIDPATQGWGSAAWNQGVEAALDEAIRKGIAPSLTLGPHWPTGIPGVRPDDDAASKELVHGIKPIDRGERFSGPVPPPVQVLPSGSLPIQNENPPVTPVLLALQAMRVITGDKLDPASQIDLLRQVHDGRLEWQAPDDGEWRIFAFWMRGTGQIQNMFGMNHSTSMLASPTPYVLDIYGPAGVTALTQYWDTNLLPERTRDLMRRAGGTVFEDSLEMSAACPWSPTVIAEFEKRRGYPLLPYLALLVSRPPTMADIIAGTGRPVLFELDGVEARRIRHDFDRTLSEMYVENRLEGLTAWAARLGMKFRVQAIGSEINSGFSAAHAQVPEGDNSNDIHGWRMLAAGRDVGGHSILSDEAGTFVRGIAHVATWRDVLYMLQRDMAGGANQIMLHGFNYEHAPGAGWPGFSAFGRAIGNDWGPRDPNWTMAPYVTAYLGRLQYLLREGKTNADLAVLGEPLKSQAVLHAGFTFQYPAMELWEAPQFRAAGGTLVPDGPAYRAIVINKLEAADLSVARRIERLVTEGLPVVIVGAAPQRTRGWRDHDKDDSEIAAIMGRLLGSPRVRQVAQQREVPGALAELGVSSLLRFTASDRVLALHRHLPERDVIYLLNDGQTQSRQKLGIALEGTVYQVDLWTGRLLRVPAKRLGTMTEIDIELAPGEPAVVIVARSPIVGAITANDAPSGQAPLPLGPWTVDLDDWRPGAGPSSIEHVRSRVAMTALVPWRALDGHEGMAGTARYSAELRLGRRIPEHAVLDLGRIEGTASVNVNGSAAIPVNPFTASVAIPALLRKGVNLIEVTVASPLNNRLLAEGIEDQGFKLPGDAKDVPPSPPPPMKQVDPDLADGPAGMTGMQPGAEPPGSKRVYRDYGLLGPVLLRF